MVQLRQTAELATRAGYATVTASSGRQALDCVRADPGIAAGLVRGVLGRAMPWVQHHAAEANLSAWEASPFTMGM